MTSQQSSAESLDHLSEQDSNIKRYYQAWHTYDAGNYVLAKEYFEQLLTAGNPKVFYFLAGMYNLGTGTVADPLKSREFYELALSENRIALNENRAITLEKHQQIQCLTNLGRMYYYGKAGEIDYKKARQYFEDAVTIFDSLDNVHGTVDPSTNHLINPQIDSSIIPVTPITPVSSVLSNDSSITITPDIQLKRFKNSYHDATLACCFLGMIHFCGNGTVKNNLKALLYLERAISGGDIYALSYLVIIYYYGQAGATVDYKKAREYAEKAYALKSNNYANSMLILALIHWQGHDGVINIPLAISLLIEILNMSEQDVDKKIRIEALTLIRAIIAVREPAINFIEEYAAAIKKSADMTNELIQLRREKELLQRQVDYQPDGPGYLAAKEDFEVQDKLQTQSYNST